MGHNPHRAGYVAGTIAVGGRSSVGNWCDEHAHLAVPIQALSSHCASAQKPREQQGSALPTRPGEEFSIALSITSIEYRASGK
jgi:hypothetical protein